MHGESGVQAEQLGLLRHHRLQSSDARVVSGYRVKRLSTQHSLLTTHYSALTSHYSLLSPYYEFACSAKLLMKEIRSERLSRFSASTLVQLAMKASTRQSIRIEECVPAVGSLPARCALSHVQLT